MSNGPEGGFGWKLNEIIGAQVFSAPVAFAEEQTWRSLKWMIVAMSLVFAAIMVLLNVLLSRAVITPVQRMAEIAEAVSMGDSSRPEYVLEGEDEIASLSSSFNRMRRSLDNAMKMLDS